MIRQLIAEYVAPLLPYVWEAAAALMMFVGLRIGNWCKKTWKRLKLPRPHFMWLVWQAISFVVCVSGATYALSQKYELGHSWFFAGLLGTAAGFLMDYLIRRSDGRNQALHDALTNGVILSEDKTVMNTVLSVATGAKVKPDGRGAPR